MISVNTNQLIRNPVDLHGRFVCRGMYVCRTLSFKGADFAIDEVPLEVKMQVGHRLLYHILLTVLRGCW